MRIIANLAAPCSQTSFNSKIQASVTNEIPLTMAQIHQVVRALFLSGRNSFMSKHDLCDAYMLLTVNVKQWPLQVQKVCGSYFVNMKQMYGDAQACHRFSFWHQTLQLLVLNRCDISRILWNMCVDDTVVMTPPDYLHHLSHFDARYEEVCSKLGLATKGHDSSGKKAFRTLQYSLDTSNLTFSLSKVNILKPSLVTLKAAQRVVGKLLDISSIWLLHFEASNYKVLLVSTCDIIFVSRLQHFNS